MELLATIQIPQGYQTAAVRRIVCQQGEKWEADLCDYPDLSSAMIDLASNTLGGKMTSTLSLEYKSDRDEDTIIEYYAIIRIYNERLCEINNVDAEETRRLATETGKHNIGVLWDPNY